MMRFVPIAALLLVAGSLEGQESEGPVVALTHVTVIDGTGEPPHPDMTVLIRGGRIERLFPSGTAPILEDAEVLDLSGRFVIPGLISAHEHLMQAGLRDSPERLRSILRRMLYGGVTTARDANGDARLLAALKRAILLAEIEGPEIHYAALMAGRAFIEADPRPRVNSIGYPLGEAPWMQRVGPGTPLELAVARAAGTGATGLKIFMGLDAALIEALTRAAHAQGLRVWSHIAVFPDRPLEVVRTGVDAVSHICAAAWQDPDLEPAINVPYVHTTLPDARPVFDRQLVDPHGPAMTRLFREMADRGTLLDATLSAMADDRGASHGCTSELAIELARSARAAGVPFVAGTDYYLTGEESFPTVHREIEYLVERDVLTPMEAIVAATRNGARLLGLEKDRGTIAPGMRADLVVLRRDPTESIQALRSVELVFKQGQRYDRLVYEAAAGSPRR